MLEEGFRAIQVRLAGCVYIEFEKKKILLCKQLGFQPTKGKHRCEC